jgi:hypothetical protein
VEPHPCGVNAVVHRLPHLNLVQEIGSNLKKRSLMHPNPTTVGGRMREAIAGREHSFGEIDPDLRIMPRAGRSRHPGKVLGVVRVRKGFGLTQHTVLS